MTEYVAGHFFYRLLKLEKLCVLFGKICLNGTLSRHWFGMSQSFF